MIMAAAQNGWLDGEKAMMESLMALNARRLPACSAISRHASRKS